MSGGVSYLELLVLNELWAGERLFCEKAVFEGQQEWERHFGLGWCCVPWSGNLVGYVLC